MRRVITITNLSPLTHQASPTGINAKQCAILQENLGLVGEALEENLRATKKLGRNEMIMLIAAIHYNATYKPICFSMQVVAKIVEIRSVVQGDDGLLEAIRTEAHVKMLPKPNAVSPRFVISPDGAINKDGQTVKPITIAQWLTENLRPVRKKRRKAK